MFRVLGYALLGMLLVLSSVASVNAGNVRALDVPSLGITLSLEELESLSSLPDESKTDFLKRVGSFLQEYSDRTGFEACSKIWGASDGTAWAVRITTNRAHNGCVTTNLPVKGLAMTPESIHSHPPKNEYRANEADVAFVGNTGLRVKDKARTEGATFSPRDFALGRGYLVTRGRLLFHAGAHAVEDLGEIPTASAVAAR